LIKYLEYSSVTYTSSNLLTLNPTNRCVIRLHICSKRW